MADGHDDIPYLENLAKAIGDAAKIKIERERQTTVKSVDLFENGFSDLERSSRRALFDTLHDERFQEGICGAMKESPDDLVRRLKNVSPPSSHPELDTVRQAFDGVTSRLNAYLQGTLAQNGYKRFADFLSRLGFVSPDWERQRLLKQVGSAEEKLEQTIDAVHKKLYGADPHQIGGVVGELDVTRHSLKSIFETYQALQNYARTRGADLARYETELKSIGADGKSNTGRTYAEVSLDHRKALRDTADLPGELDSKRTEYEQTERRIVQLTNQVHELKGIQSWTKVMLGDVRTYEHSLGMPASAIPTS